MKVLAINGSPHAVGSTATALGIVGKQLETEGVEFEIMHIGNQSIHGCMACNKCVKTQDERCVFTNDPVNEAIQKMKEADAIILGSPVHFAGMSGAMKCFLDRVFYVAGFNNGMFRGKIGAAVVAVRRTGGSSTFDTLNHYINYSEMITASSNYWNVTHGLYGNECSYDKEGVQILTILGKNIAHLIRMRAAYKEPMYELDKKVFTNHVRKDLKE